MKMRKTNDDIYYIAAVESIINNKDQTDLGEHILEYQLLPVNYYNPLEEESIDYLALGILVRMRNNESKKIEWGNIYYKPLAENKSAYSEDASKMVMDVFELSPLEKAKFITNPETKITKRSYAKSYLVDNYSFFKDLFVADGDIGRVVLGNHLPKKIKESVASFSPTIFEELESMLKEDDKGKIQSK